MPRADSRAAGNCRSQPAVSNRRRTARQLWMKLPIWPAAASSMCSRSIGVGQASPSPPSTRKPACAACLRMRRTWVLFAPHARASAAVE